jgi:ESS family glutamate:Na+ symporter
MHFDPRQTIIAGVLVLFLGKYLNRKITILRQYNIPEPVTGGLVASLFFGLVYLVSGVEVTFSTHYRDILLVVFFTAIGLSTEMKSIIRGGKILLLFTLFAVGYIFLQNYLGVVIARFFGLAPATGILAGSAALQGGHGNIVSWAPILSEKHSVANAMEVGMLSATFGLIIGGILGGPVARYLIRRFRLQAGSGEELTIGTKHGENLTIDYYSILTILLMLALSIGIGLYLHDLLDKVHFTLPLFATCMLGGVLLAWLAPLVIPRLRCLPHSPTLRIANDLSLGLFLAMAMMSLKFWELGTEALFILVSIIAQTAAILLFSVFILFRMMGKNYDAAVLTAGYIGSAMGATPTAMANMAAVTKEHGPSPIAFAVVPIVGAFIIQVSNAVVINIMLMWLGN